MSCEQYTKARVDRADQGAAVSAVGSQCIIMTGMVKRRSCAWICIDAAAGIVQRLNSRTLPRPRPQSVWLRTEFGPDVVGAYEYDVSTAQHGEVQP